MTHQPYRAPWFERLRLRLFHLPTSLCKVYECARCARRDCPLGATEHYWHDGCPYCFYYNPDGTYRIAPNRLPIAPLIPKDTTA